MKKILAIICLLFPAYCFATPTISNPPDTQLGDTIIDDYTPIQNEIPVAIEDTKSEVYHDGTPYNFIFKWGVSTKKKKRYKLDSHWTGVGISFLNYDKGGLPESKLKRGRSYVITFNPISWKKRLFPNALLVSGVGLDWYRYHFDSNYALTKIDGITQFVEAPAGVKYRDSKLLSYYVTLPILFEYHISRNSIYVSGGVVGYVKYYSKSQVEYRTEEGRLRKENRGHDLNLRPMDLKFRAQFGIKSISATFHYSPFSMFTKSNAPDLKVYSLGVLVNI